jgi:hypothetical protein
MAHGGIKFSVEKFMKRSGAAQRTGWVSFIGTAGSLFCQVVYPSRKPVAAKTISGEPI